MLDYLHELNLTLFYNINTVWISPLLDTLMLVLRNKFVWTPLYLFIISFFIFNYGWQGFFASLYLGTTVLFCDQLSSSVIKPYFEIPRPCNNPHWAEHIRVLVNCGTGFSFTSTHAANHFGVATFLGILLWNKARYILPVGLLWATLVSYAQVYVGVHYPMDVAGGAVVGLIIGTGLSLLYRRNLKTEF